MLASGRASRASAVLPPTRLVGGRWTGWAGSMKNGSTITSCSSVRAAGQFAILWAKELTATLSSVL